MDLSKRKRVMLAMKARGVPQKSIAEKFGVSRQRVWQIINEDNVIRKPGGVLLTKLYPQLAKMTGRDYTRELVRIRDGFQCQECKKIWVRGKRRLDCHHIDGNCGKHSRAYDRKDDLDSLITMCHRCHMNLHTVRFRMSKGLRRWWRKRTH